MMLAEDQPWLHKVLFAGWTGGGMKEAWCDLVKSVETLASEAGTASRSSWRMGQELPQGRPSQRTRGDARRNRDVSRSRWFLGFKTKLAQHARGISSSKPAA